MARSGWLSVIKCGWALPTGQGCVIIAIISWPGWRWGALIGGVSRPRWERELGFPPSTSLAKVVLLLLNPHTILYSHMISPFVLIWSTSISLTPSIISQSSKYFKIILKSVFLLRRNHVLLSFNAALTVLGGDTVDLLLLLKIQKPLWKVKEFHFKVVPGRDQSFKLLREVEQANHVVISLKKGFI